MARLVLKGRDVLLECRDETACLRTRQYYWLSVNTGQTS